jgi:hypothetical protein
MGKVCSMRRRTGMIFFSMALPAHSGPRLLIQFRKHSSQTGGLLGRVISPSRGRYRHTGQHKHNINAYAYQTSMPWVGFEPTIPASERAKTGHALDRAATVTGEGECRPVWFVAGTPGGEVRLGRARRRWKDNIKIYLREIGLGSMHWIHLAQDMNMCMQGSCERSKVLNFLSSKVSGSFSSGTELHGVSRKLIFSWVYLETNYASDINLVFSLTKSLYSK